MAAAEWWVMRVVQPASAEMTDAMRADLASGALAVVGGELCEPIDWYMDQESAIDRMTREAGVGNGRIYKVTLSADLK